MENNIEVITIQEDVGVSFTHEPFAVTDTNNENFNQLTYTTALKVGNNVYQDHTHVNFPFVTYDNSTRILTFNALNAHITNARDTYTVRIRATDNGNLYAEKEFTLHIDANQDGPMAQPTLISNNDDPQYTWLGDTMKILYDLKTDPTTTIAPSVLILRTNGNTEGRRRLHQHSGGNKCDLHRRQKF